MWDRGTETSHEPTGTKWGPDGGPSSLLDALKGQKSPPDLLLFRAGDRIRTGDPHLGKVMLYH
jgi:hypothetical protein